MLRREELLVGSRHKSNHLLSLQPQTGIASILLGQKMKSSTTKLVVSSSLCSKDYLSASSSCKSHSNPFLSNAQKHMRQVKDVREISISQQCTQHIRDLPSRSRKPRQKVPAERRNIRIFDKSSEQEIKVLY